MQMHADTAYYICYARHNYICPEINLYFGKFYELGDVINFGEGARGYVFKAGQVRWMR